MFYKLSFNHEKPQRESHHLVSALSTVTLTVCLTSWTNVTRVFAEIFSDLTPWLFPPFFAIFKEFYCSLLKSGTDRDIQSSISSWVRGHENFQGLFPNHLSQNVLVTEWFFQNNSVFNFGIRVSLLLDHCQSIKKHWPMASAMSSLLLTTATHLVYHHPHQFNHNQ